MQLYPGIFVKKMGLPLSLSMITLYVLPRSIKYPFIEINDHLGLIYLKLKKKKKKSSQSLFVYSFIFIPFYTFFSPKEFAALFPDVSSARFYGWIDIGFLSTLSFILLPLRYFQSSLSYGNFNFTKWDRRRDQGQMCLSF